MAHRPRGPRERTTTSSQWRREALQRHVGVHDPAIGRPRGIRSRSHRAVLRWGTRRALTTYAPGRSSAAPRQAQTPVVTASFRTRVSTSISPLKGDANLGRRYRSSNCPAALLVDLACPRLWCCDRSDRHAQDFDSRRDTFTVSIAMPSASERGRITPPPAKPTKRADRRSEREGSSYSVRSPDCDGRPSRMVTLPFRLKRQAA